MTLIATAEKNKTYRLVTRTTLRTALPVLLICSCGVLAVQPELRLVVPLLVGVTAVMTALLTLTLYCAEPTKHLWPPSVILAVALIVRLLFLFSPPQLSDDAYRYLWDGSNLLRGINPYAQAPSAVRPPSDLSDIHSLINHKQHVTIYPPAAQLLFAGGAAVGGTVTGLKVFLVLFDLGLCGLLMVLLQQLDLPLWRAVLYAWNPLPILEIAGSGHVDGAGLTLLTGAFCLLVMRGEGVTTANLSRWPFLLSGALLAGAGLVKLFPLALAPILYLLTPTSRRKQFVAGFLGVLLSLVLAFLPHLSNMFASLEVYARNWEFAGFAFNTIRSLTGSGTSARLLLASCFLVAVLIISCRLASRFKDTLSPEYRGRQALDACYAIAMAFLLLTPTLQPWYALSLAVFLPFCAGPSGLVLCWVVFLAYQVQIPYFILGEWIENPQVTAALFLAPVTAYLLSRLTSFQSLVDHRQ